MYDFQVHHDQILVPVLLRQWNLDRLQGLKATAERARERLLSHVDRVGRVVRRLVERRVPKIATVDQRLLRLIALRPRVSCKESPSSGAEAAAEEEQGRRAAGSTRA